MFSRGKVAALVAEFLGTGILAFVVLTVSRSNIGLPYFVAIAAGMAVALMGIAVARDVQLNPALTLALMINRRTGLVKGLLFIAAQLIGAFAAFELYKYFAPGHVLEVPDALLQVKGTITIAEAFGAFVFAFGAAAALYRQYHPLVRSLLTGTAYAVGVMVASVASTLAFINPFVAVASHAWVPGTYVVGPVLGALIGVTVYNLFFADKAEAVRERAAVAAAPVVTSPATVTVRSTRSSAATTKVAKKAEKKPVAKKAKK